MRKKKDTPTINVVGQLSNLMLGRVIFLKCLYPGSPVVDVHIYGVIVPNTLIDLMAYINLMTKETMLKLNLQGTFRKITMVLQLADRSKLLWKKLLKMLWFQLTIGNILDIS